jgi:YkoY family integral membrane protein
VQNAFTAVSEFFASQSFTLGDLFVVGVLTVLEGVLSVDNALVLGLLARRLPKEYQAKALNYGMFMAFVFRFAAIFAVSLLLRWTIVKFFGGAYLVYIAARHLFFETKHLDEDKVVADEAGHPKLVETTGKELTEAEAEMEIRERVPVYVKPETMKRAGVANFWPTVASIGLTDIAFAVDSILAAIALIGSPPRGPETYHPKLWVVFAGAALGMIALRFAAALVIRLLEGFPRFEIAAYLLVAVIGLKLLGDWGVNSDWSFDDQPWAARTIGAWKQSFASLETTRRRWTANYENWLEKKWVFAIHPHAPPPPGDTHPTYHLLDFHDLRRPEAMAFWAFMLAAFCTGFLPPRKKNG